MELPLLGRTTELEAALAAAVAALAGERRLVVIDGVVGSGRSALLDAVVDRAGEMGATVGRATATPATATHPGEIAEKLGISATENRGPQVMVVDEAQWADPTSVGLLQRCLGSQEGVAVILAHRPVTGHQILPLQRLELAAARRGTVETFTLEPLTSSDVAAVMEDTHNAERVVSLTGGLYQDAVRLLTEWQAQGYLSWSNGRLVSLPSLPDVWEGVAPTAALEGGDRRLVEAVSLAHAPLPLEVAAAVLGVGPDEALEVGERLADRGLIAQTREGFTPSSTLAADRTAGGMGEVRRSRLFQQLAEAFETQGWGDHHPGLVGTYYFEAGQWDRALPLLAKAASAAIDHGALGEAFPYLDSSLRAYEQAATDDPELEGRLRLDRARFYQQAGWSDLAASDLEVAVRRISGTGRIDALGFLAAVEDDRQDAQAAERLIAAAQWEAVHQGEMAKLGSLLTFHARELNRLGLPLESDAVLAKGIAILEERGSAYQLFLAKYNRARILFDRGEARKAEAAFEELVSTAEEIDGAASLADKEAWLARAQFLGGKPDLGLESIRRAIELADRTGTSGPIFLSHMGLSEGAGRYGNHEEALAEADAMLGFVLQQLPAWENAARYLRAKALLGLGRIEEAKDEAAAAYALCPEGINGWRWRLRIEALQLQIAARGEEEWPQTRAEDLTDELLQGGWLDVATELMAVRAGRERDPELGRQGAALALRIGAPGLALAAIDGGELWADPAAVAVAVAAKALSHHVPERWREQWELAPGVRSALDAPEVADEESERAAAQLQADLEEALAAAGLADPAAVLSPAQRRAGGLVRRRRVRRAISRVLAAAAIVGLSVVGVVIGVAIATPDQPAAVTTLPPTTTIPAIEDTVLAAPDRFTGQWFTFGGDQARTGLSASSGVSNATGYYWRFTKGSSEFHSSPVVAGQTVIIGSTDRFVYFIDRTLGETLGPGSRTGGSIVATPTVADFGGETGPLVYVPSDDGLIYAFGTDGGDRWSFPVDSVGSPAVDVAANRLYVGSLDGHLYALNAQLSRPQDGYVWRWPEDDVGIGRITTDVTIADGVAYVGAGERVFAINLETGQGVECRGIAPGSTVVTPVVSEGLVYVAASDQFIHVFEAGTCRFLQNINIQERLAVKPAVVDGVVYQPLQSGVGAYTLESADPIWVGPKDDPFAERALAAAVISSPTVAGDLVYFGNEEGYLYAVDAQTGAFRWRWKEGERIVASPAVTDGVVYVASFRGTVVAIGETTPESPGVTLTPGTTAPTVSTVPGTTSPPTTGAGTPPVDTTSPPTGDPAGPGFTQ